MLIPHQRSAKKMQAFSILSLVEICIFARFSFAFFLFARYKNPSELGSRSLMRQLHYL